MAKTDAQIVKEVLDRLGGQSNEAKAHEITRVLGKRVRQRARRRKGADLSSSSIPISASQDAAVTRYSPVRIEGEALSATILRDRGAY